MKLAKFSLLVMSAAAATANAQEPDASPPLGGENRDLRDSSGLVSAPHAGMLLRRGFKECRTGRRGAAFDACRGDLYCKLTAAGACRGAGRCEPLPDATAGTDEPVCGCDDQTYSSPDAAAAAGQNVRSSGACASATAPDAEEGPTCEVVAGRRPTRACGKGMFCRLPGGSCSGTGECVSYGDDDAGGGCRARGTAVCGCNDETFDNSCGAARAGRNWSRREACDAVKDPAADAVA